jgi:tetratricopeptide (TPR) repeat protein
LNDAGEREDVVARHVEWAVRFSERASRGFLREQRKWSAHLRDEQSNIRQALEVALDRRDGAAGIRIVASLGQPWFSMGQPNARLWATRALSYSGDVPPVVRGLALYGAGMLAESALAYGDALHHLNEALWIARRAGARRLEAWVLMGLGRAAQSVDVDGRSAAAWFEESLRIFREVDEPSGIGWGLSYLAEESVKEGDLERATQQANEALEIGTRAGIPGVIGNAQVFLAAVAKERGDFAEAERMLGMVGAWFEETGDRLQLSHVSCMRLDLLLESGDVARTLAPARELLLLARDVASGERLSSALLRCARALFGRDRKTEAAFLVGAVDAANANISKRSSFYRGSPASVLVEEAGLVEARRAGAYLSPEDATELALRALEEEIAKLEGGGANEAVVATALADAEPSRLVFRHDGDFWTIAYAGKEIRLRDLRGLHYVATLLREPGREFHATDLVRSGRSPSFAPALDETLHVASGLGDAGERLDAQARTAYKARLADLDDELAEAERRNDRGRLERARDEREALLAELGAAWRGERAGSDAERARLAATKGIKVALDKIAASHSELGAHLRATVRRGYFCCYVPDPRHPIEWET